MEKDPLAERIQGVVQDAIDLINESKSNATFADEKLAELELLVSGFKKYIEAERKRLSNELKIKQKKGPQNILQLISDTLKATNNNISATAEIHNVEKSFVELVMKLPQFNRSKKR